MVKSVIRAMPNLLAKNWKGTVGLLLLILAGGMLFFAGDKLNKIVELMFQQWGIDGVFSLAGMILFALILATAGYYMRKIK